MTLVQKLRSALAEERSRRISADRGLKDCHKVNRGIHREIIRRCKEAGRVLGMASKTPPRSNHIRRLKALLMEIQNRAYLMSRSPRTCVLYVKYTPSGRPRIPQGAKAVRIQVKRKATTKEKSR